MINMQYEKAHYTHVRVDVTFDPPLFYNSIPSLRSKCPFDPRLVYNTIPCPQIMGHMDVISIISDGFNVYFPMMIVALCLATYYNLGSRLLSALGFQQFIGSDGLTTDLIDEGRTLINRGEEGGGGYSVRK